jgi:hypothetical protein
MMCDPSTYLRQPLNGEVLEVAAEWYLSDTTA